MAADWFCRRFASTRALSIVVLLSAPLLILPRLSTPAPLFFYTGMAASVFMPAFPYGAMFSLVLEHAPKGIQSTAAGFTMFIANELIIGTGTYAIGFFADLFEAQAFAAPLTSALPGADAITLLALLFYFRLPPDLLTYRSKPRCCGRSSTQPCLHPHHMAHAWDILAGSQRCNANAIRSHLSAHASLLTTHAKRPPNDRGVLPAPIGLG